MKGGVEPMSRSKVTLPAAGLLLILIIVSFGVVLEAEPAESSAGSSLSLERMVLSSGGSAGMALAWSGNGTLGQFAPPGASLAGTRILLSGFWALPSNAMSGRQDLIDVPRGDCLLQNVPNPFGATTRIEYILSGESTVKVSVFNVRGQRVRTLVAATQAPGRHAALWDGLDGEGRAVSPGIYFYRLDTDEHGAIRKMVLAR
jgi:hypothetical protein